MPHIVTTNAANVSLPYQPSLASGLNSRTIVTSGTVVTLNDFEFAALSPTAFTSGALLDGGDTGVIDTVGIRLSRATANLPQSTTTNIFQVSGGRVTILNIIATVTTIVQAQATTLKLVYTPTGGAVTDLTAATTDWTGAAVGTEFVAKLNAAADVLTKVTPTGGSGNGIVFPTVSAQQPNVILSPGIIGALTVASSTGQAKWDLWYIPTDLGATVTAL